MCPLYPLHLVITYGFIIILIWIIAGISVVECVNETVDWIILQDNETKSVNSLNLTENESVSVCAKLYIDQPVYNITLLEESPDGLQHVIIKPLDKYSSENSKSCLSAFNVTGNLLGFSKVNLVLSGENDSSLLQVQPLEVKVGRNERIIDKIFIYVIIILVVIAFINMGCIIDLNIVKNTLKKPVSPLIGLISQYLFMPLCSFAIGYVLFYQSEKHMWLGLFVTGASPGGGGSNIWTYLLSGSLDLSVTMTFISTVAAFVLLPVWVGTLGPVIFSGGQFGDIHLAKIGRSVASLILPLGIGLIIRRFFPNTALQLKKMLKPVAIIFMIYVFTFGIYANLHIFYFLTWKIAVACMCLPWLGFIFGGGASLLLKRPWIEVIAISIETGVQNTGLAIGILKFALEDFEPVGDMALIIPVAVATMTPIPLTVAYIYKSISKSLNKSYSLDKGPPKYEDSQQALTDVHAVQN